MPRGHMYPFCWSAEQQFTTLRYGSHLVSVLRQVDEENVAHAHERHSALTNREVLSFSTTWINEEDTITTEQSQAQNKDADHSFYLNMKSKKVEVLEMKSGKWFPGLVARAEDGNGEVLARQYKVQGE